MNTSIAFIITFLQLAVMAAIIYMGRTDLITSTIVYGSPIYLVSHIYELNPFVQGQQLVYFLAFSFHTFKYFFLSRAYLEEDESWSRTLAFLMELGYLFICGYYMDYRIP